MLYYIVRGQLLSGLLSVCATAGFGNFDTLDVIEML